MRFPQHRHAGTGTTTIPSDLDLQVIQLVVVAPTVQVALRQQLID